MIVEISLVLGAILFAVAIHYVMQKTPVNLNAIMQDISVVNRRIEKIEENLKIEVQAACGEKYFEGRTKRHDELVKRVDEVEGQVDNCQSDLALLEKRIEELKKRPQFAGLHDEMKALQSEMKAAFEKLQEIMGMEDVEETRDEV
jgi:predicted  nucleic acid-binding Zn-ribbon protein